MDVRLPQQKSSSPGLVTSRHARESGHDVLLALDIRNRHLPFLRAMWAPSTLPESVKSALDTSRGIF